MTALNQRPLSATADATAAPTPLTRRSLLRMGSVAGALAATGAAGLLSACGSGDIVSALVPSRFIAFGDGMSDAGQSGTRYTVNDGTVNTWADRLVSRYGKTLTAQAAGGLGYAQGHAATEPLPRSIEAQVDAFLANQTFGSSDVVLMNIPLSNVLGPVAAVKAGTLTEAAALQHIADSGAAFVVQVQRLIAAGAKYIVVAGAYDLGKSPFAVAQNQVALCSAGTLKLNDTFKVGAVKLGANVLFVDAAYLVNRNIEFGPSWGFVNSKDAICTTPSALTCTDDTLTITASNKAQYLFADSIHMTPSGNQQLGDYAYDQLHGRW